jgi:hypothetical protein
VFPVRWESNKGRSGYAPACANEWKPGVCEKPRIKCGECPNRAFVPLDERTIYNHLAGAATIGVYPLLPDDTCHFLAVDFDETDWREDTRAFARSCRELDIPVALEISRSGNGAHAWIFFSRAVPAREARRLGTAVISHACAHSRQLKLSSYDRPFRARTRCQRADSATSSPFPCRSRRATVAPAYLSMRSSVRMRINGLFSRQSS